MIQKSRCRAHTTGKRAKQRAPSPGLERAPYTFKWKDIPLQLSVGFGPSSLQLTNVPPLQYSKLYVTQTGNLQVVVPLIPMINFFYQEPVVEELQGLPVPQILHLASSIREPYRIPRLPISLPVEAKTGEKKNPKCEQLIGKIRALQARPLQREAMRTRAKKKRSLRVAGVISATSG